MPFYTGKSDDGSDMTEVVGGYVNPDNENEWSSEPYPAQKKFMRPMEKVKEYMGNSYSFQDVYEQIQNKTCKLSATLRKYVSSHYDEDGNFIEDEKEN